MRSKEELELMINEQKEILKGVQDKFNGLEEERENLIKGPEREEYVGRFFKYENSYGEGDTWFMYYKVTGTMGGFWDVKTVSFQKSTTGEVTVDLDQGANMKNLGEEITEGEFLEAWYELRAEMGLAVEGRC